MTTTTTIIWKTTDAPVPLDDVTAVVVDGVNYNILDCPPLRWGIIGCGRVSHDFVLALLHVPTAAVVACATRNDPHRAHQFASLHEIPYSYGSYEELVSNPEVDVVYVGNVHSVRRQVGEMCLFANKHTLLEKPFACSLEDANYLIGLARERNLFLMEGLWTRFFPAVEMARRLAFGSPDGVTKGILGEVVKVFSDFNLNAADFEVYPDSFFYNRRMGGGAGMLVGPYPISAATLFFPGRTPDLVQIAGQVDANTGVDLQGCITLRYAPTGDVSPARDVTNTDESTPKLPGAGLAQLSFGILCESAEITTVIGTKGRLVIETPCHNPTRLSVRLKGEGRGNAASEQHYEFPLPADTDEIIAKGGYFYPNSAGFCYEAAAVARCIAAGRMETPQYTLAETQLEMYLLDQIRQQLGVKAVHED